MYASSHLHESMLRKLLERMLYLPKENTNSCGAENRGSTQKRGRENIQDGGRGGVQRTGAVHQTQRAACPDFSRSESSKKDFIKYMNTALGYLIDI